MKTDQVRSSMKRINLALPEPSGHSQSQVHKSKGGGGDEVGEVGEERW